VCVCVCAGGVRVAEAVLVSGPALRPILQLVERPDGAAGEGLEAHGDDGESPPPPHSSTPAHF